ncbi:MAG: CPBP family intramembrane glutamic endopeptidase [Acidobacteriota bacterium]
MCAYIATFVGSGYVAVVIGFRNPQWLALLAAVVATLATVGAFERFQFPIGLSGPPVRAMRELLWGSLFAAILIGICDLLIMASTPIRHARGSGLPWRELVAVYVPAALHEELAFRGYIFQKLRRWRRGAAFLFSGGVFAALHLQNDAVTALAIGNIALAGVMLALAYERFGRLWFPIGVHFVWNLASGPVLGYGVSGYASSASLFVTRGGGAEWLTGGAFGIEGSLWATAVEVAAVAVLWRGRPVGVDVDQYAVSSR